MQFLKDPQSDHSFLRGFEIANWIDFYWLKRASIRYDTNTTYLFEDVAEVQNFSNQQFPPADPNAHGVMFALAVSCLEDDEIPNLKFCRVVEAIFDELVQKEKWNLLSRAVKKRIARRIAELLPLRPQDARHQLDCAIAIEDPSSFPLVDEVMVRLHDEHVHHLHDDVMPALQEVGKKLSAIHDRDANVNARILAKVKLDRLKRQEAKEDN
jgi:hypothetical protein